MNLLARLCLMPLLLAAGATQADIRTWKASTTGEWFTAANWVEEDFPKAGDTAIVTNRGSTILLTNSTAPLASLVLGGMVSNSITFTNWNTTLAADQIEIRNQGMLLLPAAFSNADMSNNIVLVCTNLLIAAGGKIDTDAKGYSSADWVGNGPGGGTNFGTSDHYDTGGAGHGGYGGRWQKTGLHGLPYGSVSNPVAPGSGSENAASGNHGGGAARIHAALNVTVNGSILANGGTARGSAGAYGAGASGGSVWITCRTFAGTNGVISANGGGASTGNTGGGGSGGRISLQYDPGAQAAMPISSVRITAAGGTGTRIFTYGDPGTGNPDGYGDPGTLFLPDLQLLRSPLVHSGRLVVPDSFNSWSVSSLWVSNTWIQFPTGFAVTVSGDLLSSGTSARLVLKESPLTVEGNLLLNGGSLDFNAFGGTGLAVRVGGNLLLTNSAKLIIRGGLTNAATPDWGVLMAVTGNMTVATNCIVYPWSHPTNGGSPFFVARSLDVHPGGSFNADGVGYPRGLQTNGFGPGGGKYQYGGGGYGGKGGKPTAPGGQAYGDSNAPIHAGSGGAGLGFYTQTYVGQDGGGVIRIETEQSLSLKGTMRCNGGSASAYGSGGAGGSIYLRTRVFAGENGLLSAQGGTADRVNGYGGGGGGRIAVWRMIDSYAGALSKSVAGGPGSGPTGTGDVGTVVFDWIPFPSPGVVIVIH